MCYLVVIGYAFCILLQGTAAQMSGMVWPLYTNSNL